MWHGSGDTCRNMGRQEASEGAPHDRSSRRGTNQTYVEERFDSLYNTPYVERDADDQISDGLAARSGQAINTPRISTRCRPPVVEDEKAVAMGRLATMATESFPVRTSSLATLRTFSS